MDTYEYSNQTCQYRKSRSRLFIVLVLLTVQLTIGFISLAAQSYIVPALTRQDPAPTYAVSLAAPTVIPSSTPEAKPTPRPTSMPAQRPAPASDPASTQSSGSGVLGYPVFNGNIHVPEIALSFDDGPNPPYTTQILNVLQSYGVQATFFVIGSRVNTYPDLVRQEYEQGNAIGNHTWTHPELTRLSSAAVYSELQQTSDAIQSVIGVAPTVFRPPYEKFNASVQSIAASLGLSTVLWNVDPRDWALPGTHAIIANVLSHVRDGSIIEMHDGGGYRGETVEALPTIITTLEQRGYRFVTIPRLIADMTTASGATTRSQMVLAAPLVLSAVLPCMAALLKEKSMGKRRKITGKQRVIQDQASSCLLLFAQRTVVLIHSRCSFACRRD